MRLTIFGATGATGRQLVEQALAAGHQVVAFARNPSRLNAKHERLTIVQGELADQAMIEHAVKGADAVISVLGPRGNSKSQPVTRGTHNILAAMKKQGVRRLIISSTPSASDPNDLPDLRFKMAIGLVRLALHSAYEDIVNTASVVRASNCDWTIVRVSMLTNAPKTGRVKAGYVDKTMGMRLSRADMAEFILQQAQDTKYVRQAPAISNG